MNYEKIFTIHILILTINSSLTRVIHKSLSVETIIQIGKPLQHHIHGPVQKQQTGTVAY